MPRIPDSITEDQLSRDVREELGGLSIDRAATVGRYLVAAELASDAEQAYRYAQAAKKLAARVGVVREVSGVMAYKSGRWAEALTELQAGRRMTGRNDYLPLMADSERGLGRLDRALDLVHSAEAKRLPRASQIELRIVESGIRRDQGLADAAVLALEVPELTDGKQRPWSARLFYAYGEALIAAGRPEAAREAFSRAVVADEDEQTDALARLDELDGITVHDLEDDEDDDSDVDVDDEEDDEDDLDDERRRRPRATRMTTTIDEDDLDDEADDDLDDETTKKTTTATTTPTTPDDDGRGRGLRGRRRRRRRVGRRPRRRSRARGQRRRAREAVRPSAPASRAGHQASGETQARMRLPRSRRSVSREDSWASHRRVTP